MNMQRKSTIGLWLTFFVAACGPLEPANPTDGDAGSGNPGTGGSSTPTGGKGGTAGATSTGGSAGTGAPGTGGTGAPGTGGTGTPGTGGTGAPGTGGTGTAGTGGTGVAGSGGTSLAGTGGTGIGGIGVGGSSGDGSGGLASGGTGNEGGTPAAGSGGSAGTPPVVDEPVLITSTQGAYWKVGTVTEVTAGTADVTVNDAAPAQDWSGFGGTFNEKGWDALSQLSAADRERALKLLFDDVDGAKFTYGRIPIGASDYAMNRYTLNDTANDATQANFSLTRDKEKLIPYIKAAMALKPSIHFWGSPWSPPAWMKTNNALDRGNMKDDATVLGAYAIYLSKFVEEYGKEGITIEAVHPQNEPGYEQDYPSCLWSGALMAKFIGTYLGPEFTERGITAKIFIGTMSNNATDGTVLSTVMANATAKPYVKGYGLQWGMLETYSNLNLDRNLAIWQTEHKCGNYPWVGGTNQSRAPNDHAYGVESWGLIRDWIKKGVNAYSAWNMVLDTVGRSLDTVRPWAQNALLAVDTSAKTLNPTPAYYVFRHFSQYVDPGAKVVGTTGGDAIAFKNPDGALVAVIYNSGAAKTSTVAIGGKKLQFAMPANGWATVNYQ